MTATVVLTFNQQTKNTEEPTDQTGNSSMTNENKSASLAYSDIKAGGSSDKVYILNLEASGDGFAVTAQYGRRGGALATDNKTKNGPVDYDAALKIFERVEREKIAKGYRLNGLAAPAAQVVAPLPEVASEVFAQELLSEISEQEAAALVLNRAYLMQDKSDGQSRGVVKIGGVIFGLNKAGRRVPLPAELHAELAKIELSTFQLDAELVGDRLVCRDLLNADGDIDGLSYDMRFTRLVEVIGSCFSLISVVETWDGSANKAKALARSIAERREGVVFKLRGAPHRAGRNGQHKKFKFVKTLSAIAGEPRATGKDSVEIFLYDDFHEHSKLIRVGTVGLIGKPNIKKGDVLEVAYLYAFPSKLLSQARLLRVRDDVEECDCTTSQLVMKREEGGAK